MNDICIERPTQDEAGCTRPCRYELRFCSLFDEHRGLSFPCDQRGQVCIDELKPQERRNYFFARALVGHDFALPAVVSYAA